MKRMAASNVLIVGMEGLGVEIGAHDHAYIRLLVLNQSTFSQLRTSFSLASSPLLSMTPNPCAFRISAPR